MKRLGMRTDSLFPLGDMMAGINGFFLTRRRPGKIRIETIFFFERVRYMDN